MVLAVGMLGDGGASRARWWMLNMRRYRQPRCPLHSRARVFIQIFA